MSAERCGAAVGEFVVPQAMFRVTSINVTAVGGKGGAGIPQFNSGGTAGAGGLGAMVSGTIPVTGGETLYVEVAGNGQDATPFPAAAGGFNGGGNGDVYSGDGSGGGGGASDVRTTSCGGTCPGQAASLATRLLVAAGGGGGGGSDGFSGQNGGNGGAAGNLPQAGTDGADVSGAPGSGGKGGGAGSSSQGGIGGAAGTPSACCTAAAGTDGSSGQGGIGQHTVNSQSPGGGGGGGYYGAGGGGSGAYTLDGDQGIGGGGGGAGSSFVDLSATNPSIGSDATGVPVVTISYTAPGLQGQDGTSHNAVEGAAMNNATLGTFTDPNTSAVASDFTATVCWNDGGTPPPNNDCGAATVSGSNGSFTVTGSHTFPEEGSFTAVTSVTGADGSATLHMPVTVADAPLTATGVKASVPSKKSFTKVVANFKDADPGGTTSDFSATINWGDGTPTTGGLIAPNGLGGWSVTGSHKYAAPGNGYSVTVSITDHGGANTSTTSVFKVNK